MLTKLVPVGPYKFPVTQGHDGVYYVSTQVIADACEVPLNGDEAAMMPIPEMVDLIAGWAMAGRGKAAEVLVYCAMDP